MSTSVTGESMLTGIYCFRFNGTRSDKWIFRLEMAPD